MKEKQMNDFIKNNIPFYFINLEKDLDRKAYIENHLNELNIKNFKRIDAVFENPNKINANMSNKEVGCSLSHLKAIEEFYNSSYDICIICEDDADFSNLNNKEFNIEKIITYSENFCLQTSVISRLEDNIMFNIKQRSFWDFGTSSYIINKKYAKKIIDAYGTFNDPKLYNFISKNIIDPRGGNIITRPVADELIYSLCNVLVFPIFCFKDFKSTINSNAEQEIQIKESIKKFNEYWYKNE